MTTFTKKYLNLRNLLFLYLLLAIAASTQSILLTQKKDLSIQGTYTDYNNYIIFKQSAIHLLDGLDLYEKYPGEHWDLYKYSPTFALLFSPLAALPDWLGLNLWNILNVLVLFLAIRYLKGIGDKSKIWILLLMVIELLGSMQNEQSNALMAGLMILAFGSLEKGKRSQASLFIVAGAFIKLFSLAGFALFLFYPGKLKSALYSLLWVVVFLILPLPFIGYKELIMQYSSWTGLLSSDHSVSYGLSVMGWLNAWFGLNEGKNAVLLIGIILFCIPLFMYKKYGNYRFRLLALSSLLIWVVIFNHKAESPTFVIAISGIAIWYFTGKRNVYDTILMIFAFVFTSLSPTDLFPAAIRNDFVIPYVLKAFPCILIWLKILYSQVFLSGKTLAGQVPE